MIYNIITKKWKYLILYSIFLFLLFIDLEGGSSAGQMLVEIPKKVPNTSSSREEISIAVRVSPDMLEAIKSRPLFIESRKPPGQDWISETSNILIDGRYTTVELIGTIESTNKQTAAFALGDQSTVWIEIDDYLGDWRIQEITQHRVRLTNENDVRLMQIRKAARASNQAAEG